MTQRLKQEIELELDREVVVPSKVLMGRFCFLFETSQFTQAYADKRYFPFFYYLGRKTQPKRLLEMGFGLGFISGSFLQGCPSVEQFVAYQAKTPEFYSHRLGRRNILAVYKNAFQFCDNLLSLKDAEYDLILINNDDCSVDQYRSELDVAWQCLAYDGLLVIDHAKYGGVCKGILPDFCKVINREPEIVNTRYGTAIIRK